MQHTRRPSRQRSRMLGRINTVPTGLHADNTHGLVFNKRVEHTDGVASATDACHDHVGQLTRLFEQLSLTLFADHALEVTHNEREGVRPDGGADKIVGGSDVGDPVAHGLVDGILEGARAGFNWNDSGAEHAHPEDVEGLTPAILRAHVDDALKPKLGACSGSRDTVLPGTGLGNDAAFAKAFGQKHLITMGMDQMIKENSQCLVNRDQTIALTLSDKRHIKLYINAKLTQTTDLANGIINLVRARVIQILTFQPDSGTAWITDSNNS
ncbi:hypothetical protein BC937DRAFT_94835 [Endogone sp. FLAS-F59071]|nr:hypothetical protein BC937DRAFT_94835 [Endogone sp. FLAS-F59071]|eukprot:RUS13750.1 hypothetical protein BC937DRAFT_94835 [Endogone sp. FLAS-F59071]